MAAQATLPREASAIPSPDWLWAPAPAPRAKYMLGTTKKIENFRLKDEPSFGLRGRAKLWIDRQYGLWHGYVSVTACADMLGYVTAAKNRSPDGFLLLGSQRAQRAQSGYGTYNLHEGKHVARFQEQYVSIIQADAVQIALKWLPGYQLLARDVTTVLGCTISCIKSSHILLQRQAMCVFTWHNDHEDMSLSPRMVTVVITLNDADSGCQVWGFEPFRYTGQGCMVAFSGAAQHRSIRSPCCVEESKDIWERTQFDLKRGPVKLVFFIDA